MGRTIKLTEEQIKRFFGEGFGRRLIGEGNLPTNYDVMKKKEQLLGSQEAQDIANKVYGNTMSHPDRSNGGADTDDSTYHLGFRHVPREGKDLPGYAGSAIELADFGSADLNNENAINNNALLDEIFREHQEYIKKEVESGKKDVPKNLNLIDVLEIMHKLKDKKLDPKNAGKEAFDFLNSINIDYILSNFVTVNAPDYVFWRLKNLTPQEIANVKKTYGRDFSGFGQRCDGCGITEWKTTISPFEHDDAHINLEYMGSDASSKPVNISESVGGPRKFNTYPVPFQIHHMNENPGDNSPLNLSCLCPNCHTMTGSYGIRKGNIKADTQKILSQLEDLSGGISGATGSLNEMMPKEEKEKIVRNLKAGDFERRDISNSIIGVGDAKELEIEPTPNVINHISQFGVKNPTNFITDFNELFYEIWDEGYEMYVALHKLREGRARRKDDFRKAQQHTIDGVPFTSIVRCIEGKITLEIYAGDPPFMFNAFKNRGILLNPMYYESDENRENAKIEIRNMVFSSVLNALKEYKTKMSNWRAPDWLQRDIDKGGDGESKNDLVAQRIKDIKPSGEAYISPDGPFGKSNVGRMDVLSFFNNPEMDDYSAGKAREIMTKKQSRTKGNFSESTDFPIVEKILTIPEERLGVVIGKCPPSFSKSLIDFLVTKRREGYGNYVRSLRTIKEKNAAIKQLLIDGGFYQEKPQTIKP